MRAVIVVVVVGVAAGVLRGGQRGCGSQCPAAPFRERFLVCRECAPRCLWMSYILNRTCCPAIRNYKSSGFLA